MDPGEGRQPGRLPEALAASGCKHRNAECKYFCKISPGCLFLATGVGCVGSAARDFAFVSLYTNVSVWLGLALARSYSRDDLFSYLSVLRTREACCGCAAGSHEAGGSEPGDPASRVPA